MGPQSTQQINHVSINTLWSSTNKQNKHHKYTNDHDDTSSSNN